MPSNGYFLICRKEMSGCDTVETKLSLHNEYDQNGELTLKNSSGSIIDSTPIPEDKIWPGGDNETKQTMEWTGNAWQTSVSPNGTPKAQNSINVEPVPPKPEIIPELQEESNDDQLLINNNSEDATSTPPLPAPVKIEYPRGIYINEIMPSPEGADAEHEWIELYNSNGFEVDLSKWQIRDKVGAVKTYTCPINTKIMSYGFLLVPRPESKITLQNSGDGLELLNPNKKLVYSIYYPKATQGQSYSRVNENWKWSTIPTPEKQNIIPQPIQPEPAQLRDTSQVTATKNQQWEDGPPVVANIEDNTGNNTSKTSNRILIFISAIIIAIGSGVIVLVLKQKSTDK